MFLLPAMNNWDSILKNKQQKHDNDTKKKKKSLRLVFYKRAGSVY